METTTIKIIAGSTREGRFSDQAAAWIASELKKREGITVEILDLRDYAMPFFDSPVSPSMKSKPYEHEVVDRFTKKIAEGDAFIIVTPEYNRSTSAVLKNALDWVYQEWNNKPVAFVSYGTVGGARAVEQLRLIAIELQMAPIRESVHFAGDDYFPVHFTNAPTAELFATYEKKASATIDQLLTWSKALKSLRA